MNTIHFSGADFDLSTFVAKVIADSEPTVLESESGKKVVVMPLEDFTGWQETAYLLSNPVNAEHLRQSIAQARSNKVIEHELDEV
jgi:antitoxin YefM